MRLFAFVERLPASDASHLTSTAFAVGLLRREIFDFWALVAMVDSAFVDLGEVTR